MEFHDVNYLYKSLDEVKDHLDALPFNNNVFVRMKTFSCLGHWALFEAQRPLYRIWPEYVDMFSKTRLDNIPLDMFKMPFPAWTILFPKDTYFVRPFLEVKYLKVYDFGNDFIPILKGIDVGIHHIIIEMTVNDRRTPNSDDMVLLNDLEVKQYLVDNPTATIQQAIDHQMSAGVHAIDPSYGELAVYATELLDTMIRIICSISFVATGGYRFIAPDILNADMARWLEAQKKGDTKRMAELEQRAHKRRKSKSYTIGKSHTIRLPNLSSGSSDTTGSGRELVNSHQRGAHFHVYHTGKGRTERTVKFIPPIVVRDDLPPKPSATPVHQFS